MASVVAVIPALDEERTIAGVVRGAARAAADVVVVDNGSTDGTAAAAAAAGARVVAEPDRGYGAACLAGALAAPADAVLLFLDGDGSDDLRTLARVAGPVVAGEADLVLGSRMRGQREPGALASHQVAANRAVAALIRARWRVPVTDVGPVRAIHRDRLVALGMRSRASGWPVEMVVRAARGGLRIEEVPVDLHRRAGGGSKVSGSLTGSVRAGAGFAGVLLRHALVPRRWAR